MTYILYFSIKTIQLISDFFFIKIFILGGGFKFLLEVFLGIIAMTALLWGINKLSSPFKEIVAIISFILLVVGSFLNYYLIAMLFPIVGFYALIYFESLSLHLLYKYRNISRLSLFGVSLIPALGLYLVGLFLHQPVTASKNISEAFYIITFLVSLLASYSDKFSKEPDRKKIVKVSLRTLIIALGAIIGSFIIYYILIRYPSSKEDRLILIESAIMFYITGGVVIFNALNWLIWETRTKWRRKS